MQELKWQKTIAAAELKDFDRRLDNRAKQQQKRQKQKSRNQDAILSGVMGGAFPLLFGQGPGTSLVARQAAMWAE